MEQFIGDFISIYMLYLVFGVLMFVLFAGGIYLLIRPIILWYFKIYAIISELQENNRLLRDMLDELKKTNRQTPSSNQSQADYSKYMPR